MPDFADYPEDLQPILLDFSEAVDALMRDFQAGKISLDEWRDRFAELLAMYIGTSYMTGAEKDDILGDAGIWITAWLALQLDFLNGFRDTIAANYAAGGQYSGTWDSRAQMYVTSPLPAYWYGVTEGLPLPAYPRDGTSQCLANDRCMWRIVWDDREAGNARAYWELEPGAEHCQTCLERRKQWYPLVVRNWRLVIPAEAKELTEKHLPGQHDQSMHGIRAAGSEKPKYGPDGRPQNLASVNS